MTPLTNLNSGFRMYEVDLGDFQVSNYNMAFATSLLHLLEELALLVP